MPNNCLLLLCLLFALLPLPGFAAPPAAGLQITGAVVKPADYTSSALRGQFGGSLQTVTYMRRGVKHTAQAVSLWAVLQAAAPRVNPQIKNHVLQFVVLASGRDGYTAAFSFGELAPAFGNKPVWLALDEDNKPQGEGTGGGIDLIVPSDVKAGRWVHSVTHLAVVDEAAGNEVGRG